MATSSAKRRARSRSVAALQSKKHSDVLGSPFGSGESLCIERNPCNLTNLNEHLGVIMNLLIAIHSQLCVPQGGSVASHAECDPSSTDPWTNYAGMVAHGAWVPLSDQGQFLYEFDPSSLAESGAATPSNIRSDDRFESYDFEALQSGTWNNSEESVKMQCSNVDGHSDMVSEPVIGARSRCRPFSLLPSVATWLREIPPGLYEEENKSEDTVRMDSIPNSTRIRALMEIGSVISVDFYPRSMTIVAKFADDESVPQAIRICKDDKEELLNDIRKYSIRFTSFLHCDYRGHVDEARAEDPDVNYAHSEVQSDEMCCGDGKDMSEDIPEFGALQMQAIIDMSIQHYATSQGISVDCFIEIAEQLKTIYNDRGNALYSKRQARKLMELAGQRCVKKVPPGIKEKL